MIEDCINSDNPYNKLNYLKIHSAGIKVVKEAIELGLEQDKAIAKISLGSLEQKISEKIHRKQISRVLRKEFNNTNFGEGIEKLRENVANELFPNNNFLSFNQTDLMQGFTHPGKLSFSIAYLLGVYRADLKFIQANKVRLCGKEDDELFYNNLLLPMFKKNFSINLTINKTPREKHGYVWNDIYLEFSSKEHLNYIKNINFIDKNHQFKEVYFEDVKGIDCSRMNMYKEAYLMGIIAGAGHVFERKLKSNTNIQLHFKNKKMNYLQEFKRMLEDLDQCQDVKYINSQSKPHFLYLTEENFRLLANYKTNVNITPNQIGLFTNPKHLGVVKNFY